MTMPTQVTVVEVGPRDGLQNVRGVVPTDIKIAFVDALSAAGLPQIEVTSFVSPRWIPQLADAGAVYAHATKRPGTRYSALVPNLFGFERALEVEVSDIAVFTAASETFNQHNINASIDEALQSYASVCARAAAEGVPVRAYISTAFGCPYEGAVAPETVARLAGRLFELGVHQIALSDTDGSAVPNQVVEVVGAVVRFVPLERLAVHFHDTHGRALTNIYAALQCGVSTIDASAGGLGGCPYSPGASGNVATEDLIALLDGMGIETGVDLEKLIDASLLMENHLGRALPGRHLQAARGQRAQR